MLAIGGEKDSQEEECSGGGTENNNNKWWWEGSQATKKVVVWCTNAASTPLSMWCPGLLSFPYLCCALTMKDRCVSRDGSSCGSRTSRPRQGSLSELTPTDPRRPTVLRPPRQGAVSEVEGGGVCFDRTSYHYMCQDVTALKTMLLRLRRVLQAADTINPFDANLRNSLYLSLASGEVPGGTGINGDKDSLTPSVAEISQENVDLKRQVVLLQQQLDERDRVIRLLQQQLAQSIGSSNSQPPTCTSPEDKSSQNTVNAATQTDRSTRPTLMGSSLSRTASIDDGLGPTVSSEVESERMGRGRSTSTPDYRQPRAASQPPTSYMRGPPTTTTNLTTTTEP